MSPRRSFGTRALLVLTLSLLTSCATRRNEPPPNAGAIDVVATQLTEVRELVRRGSYSSLTRAHELCGELWPTAHGDADVRDALLHVSALLALRERQLAIPGDRYLEIADELLAACPDCEELATYVEIVRVIPLRDAGVVRDLDTAHMPSRYRAVRSNLADWLERLRRDGAREATAATFHLELLALYEHMVEEELSPEAIAAPHEGSPLVLFTEAFRLGESLAKKTLALEPSFSEAHLILGRSAAARRRTVEAESHYRQAHAALPGSIAAGLGLADAVLALEEYAEAGKLYAGLLELAPEHREARLRLGISLSLRGETEAAIAALEELLDLGNWYLGEAHYWLAWNEQRRGRTHVAEGHVAQARLSLPNDPRVYALAGGLALESGDLERAEDDFLEVLALAEGAGGDYEGHAVLCDSLYSLGRIETRRERWEKGVLYFGRAAGCREAALALVDREIEDVRSWTALPDTRRAALLARKERQRARTELEQAGSHYNAAVCALRAGRAGTAESLALKAAAHPRYEGKAMALLARLR